MALEDKAILKSYEGGRSLWAQSMRRLARKKVGMGCLTTIALLYLTGLLAAWVAPYPYDAVNLNEVKQRPSWDHPFGTDRAGRDILSRIIYGLRTAVIITVAAVATGGLILGITMGLISGYFGKLADSVIMRVGEIFLAFPDILLVLIIAATVRPRVVSWVRDFQDATGIDWIIRLGIVDYVVVFGALTAFSWVGMARLVRGQVLYIKQSQYVESAQAIGASTKRILLLHILPNVISPVIVVVSMSMASVFFAAIVLGWLGIGIQPPTPDLGRMIFENGSIGTLRSDPHLLLFPVGTVTILVFCFNLLGDALNDAFNPRAR